MLNTQPKIFPLGESAVVVEFGNIISEDLNRKAICLAEHLTANPFPGYIESVPAYTSTTIFYDLVEVRRRSEDRQSVFDSIAHILRLALADMKFSEEAQRDVIKIPATFNKQSGPDLEFVSETSSLAIDEIIKIFTSATYRVYMVGFLPGFAYMGELDERLSMPRKQQPRQAVPKGSIGVAGRQTGIYPLESPGGWQLIGRTEIELFMPDNERPTLLGPGDVVRFVPI